MYPSPGDFRNYIIQAADGQRLHGSLLRFNLTCWMRKKQMNRRDFVEKNQLGSSYANDARASRSICYCFKETKLAICNGRLVSQTSYGVHE